jgi:trehalose 6-phosphate synthase
MAVPTREHMMPLHASRELLRAERLVLATNRGPVEYSVSDDETLQHRRGAGGLVTALTGMGSRTRVTWVALAMTDGDRLAAQQAQRQGQFLPSPLPGCQMDLRYVVLPKSTFRKHYEQISNRVLWFLQHYLADPAEASRSLHLIEDAWHNGYRKANQAMAEAVCEEIEREHTEAAVMLHDYHLYLAPAMIRRRHPSIAIQQFIHIPWPAVRYWQSFLPEALTRDIYGGLLGNDVLGLQTRRDVQNFLEGARVVLEGAEVDTEAGVVDWHDHRTLVRDYPISIAVSEERRLVESVEGERAAECIRPQLCEQTIMRVDRIEPTKNIVLGFQAYRRLLETHPELRGRVTFLAFLVPSRQALRKYRRYQAEVLRLIEDINRRYSSDGWTPIHAFVGNDRTQALVAMQYYDVLLVNPLIDGMNLVAKEGPVVNQRNGVLVLSRTAGAFQQLGRAALPTSPTDLRETAEALYQALTLPADERRLKARLARSMVEHDDLDGWMSRQVRDLNQVIAGRSEVLTSVAGPRHLSLRELLVASGKE